MNPGIRSIALVALMIGAVSAPALADTSPYYFGAKLGMMKASIFGQPDDVMNGGLVAGYTAGRYIVLEGELTKNLATGKFKGLDGVSWSATTAAAYVAFRNPDDVYLKGKIGFVKGTFNITGPDVYGLKKDYDGTFTDMSYGLGLGAKLERGHRVEAEFTVIQSELKYISIGYYF